MEGPLFASSGDSVIISVSPASPAIFIEKVQKRLKESSHNLDEGKKSKTDIINDEIEITVYFIANRNPYLT